MTSTGCTECDKTTPPCPRYDRSRLGTKLAFLKNGTCSKTLMTVLDSAFGHPLPHEEHATNPLAGGLMRGYQCGMLWGSTLAAGAAAYRHYGPGPDATAAAMRAATRLVPAFRAQNNHINCLEIIEVDPRGGWQTFKHFFIKGGTFVCMRRAADFAPIAMERINAALTASDTGTGCSAPMSCAARVAEEMGANRMHQAMAAGLAGGIGFSGGACGALGAAIWLTGIRGRETGDKARVTRGKIEALVERFLKQTDYEFECADIVGKRFDGIADHSAYVGSGGCARLIEALSTAEDRAPDAEVRRSA